MADRSYQRVTPCVSQKSAPSDRGLAAIDFAALSLNEWMP